MSETLARRPATCQIVAAAVTLLTAWMIAPRQIHAVAEVGTDFRISSQGPDGDPLFRADEPDGAYNPVDEELLVVWTGTTTAGCAPGSRREQIHAQRIAASTGETLGPAVAISSSDSPCSLSIRPDHPAVAHNATTNEYLVVWQGAWDPGILGQSPEQEILGQRLAADGTEIGTDDFRVSDMGPAGDSSFGAELPDVVWASVSNEFLVVWGGDDDREGMIDTENEIFGQRLDAVGAEIGANDFRISAMGGSGETEYDAFRPAVAYAAAAQEFLVAWIGEDDEAALHEDEKEIFVQLLMADGSEIGTDDRRISDMGGLGTRSHAAGAPDVAWSPKADEYLVVWEGDDDEGGLVDNENEIFGQRLDALGAEIGANDFRISALGGTGDGSYDAFSSAVVATSDGYLVAWHGDHDGSGQIEGELEIFVQRLGPSGEAIGPDDLRVSDAGGLGESSFDALRPAVAGNPVEATYLVVWQADDDAEGTVDGEVEVFGQRLVLPLFSDGFETGDLSAWNLAQE